MKLSIVESSEDAIVALTLDGIVVSWDRGAQKIYGYQSKEIIGKPLSVLLPSDRPEDISEILEKIKSGERVDHYETARLRKDGQIVYVSLTVFPIRNTASRIIGASSIIRDITKRKETENALRESRGHLARTQAFPMC
jgi:PAS domain S-box-containing protein